MRDGLVSSLIDFRVLGSVLFNSGVWTDLLAGATLSTGFANSVVPFVFDNRLGRTDFMTGSANDTTISN